MTHILLDLILCGSDLIKLRCNLTMVCFYSCMRYNCAMTYKLSSKRVYQIDPDTHEVIKVWNSVTEAANACGVTIDAISQLCKRTGYYLSDENYKPKLVAGFEFEFAPEIIEKRIEKRYRVDNTDGTIGNMVYKKP